MSTILTPTAPIALAGVIECTELAEIWVRVGSVEPLTSQDFAAVEPLVDLDLAGYEPIIFNSDPYSLDDEPEDIGYPFDQWWVLRKA